MRILIHGRHFPVAMFRFFHWAFQDLGHEVFSVGPFSGATIPWGDFKYPEYQFPPDYLLPDADVSLKDVLDRIDFKPDIVFQAADTIFLEGPSPVPNAILMTDPHAVDYTPRLKHADFVFNMQDFYKQRDQTWIPYAHYPYLHKYIPTEKEYDVVFSGLQYEHRVEALNKMKEHGLHVLNTLGLIYEDYVFTYNKGKIAFNWSSKNDLPARFWEGLAMRRLVLTNRCPDLKKLEFKEGHDYVGFDSIDEAVEKALYYAHRDSEREKIARNGWEKVQKHTYKERAKKILKCFGQ